MSFKTSRQEDTKVFLNNTEFGTDAIYNSESIVINIQEEMDTETGEIYPLGLIPLVDAPNLVLNDVFIVGIYNYSVISIFPILPTDVFYTVKMRREKI